MQRKYMIFPLFYNIFQLCKGLTDYFNLCFSRILFYEKEESQFKKALDAISIEDPCEIYGVEHLCRLFGI